jgi:hypothetical protein
MGQWSVSSTQLCAGSKAIATLTPSEENAARVEQVLIAFSFASLDQPLIFCSLDASCLSRELLVKNKRATGRTQDLADVEKLEP